MTQKPELEKAVYNIYEVAALLGINLPKAYELARQENFPSVRVGRRIIVPRVSFHRWLEQAALDKQSHNIAQVK